MSALRSDQSNTKLHKKKREATIHETTPKHTKEPTASCYFVYIRGQSSSSFLTATRYKKRSGFYSGVGAGGG